MMLYHFSDGDGNNAFPGNTQLARKCGVSESTVKDALKLLKQTGCIEQVSRGGRAGDGRKWASNYSLLIPGSTSGESDLETSTSGESDLETDSQRPESGLSTSGTDFSTSGTEMSTSDSGASQRPDLPSQRPENRPPPNHKTPNHVSTNHSFTQPTTSEPVTPRWSVPECVECGDPIFDPDHEHTGKCKGCTWQLWKKSTEEKEPIW